MADIVLRRAPYAGGPVNVVLGGDDAPVDAPPSWVTGAVSLSGPVATGFIRYDNAVPRRVEALCAAPWVLARRAERDLSARWTPAETREVQTDAVWREARDVSAQVSLDWAACDRLSQAVQIAWGAGQRAAREIALRHLVCERARLDVGLAWASGRSAHVQASAEWARPRGLRSEIEVSAQIARRMLVAAGTGWSAGRSVGIGAFLVPWRYTRPLRPGADTWVRPGPVTPETHTPDLQIVLRCPVWSGGAVNVLLGRVCTDPVGPLAPLYILPARYFMQVHSLVAHRLPDLADVPIFDVSLSADAGSYAWAFSASAPVSVFDQLAPVSGLPQQIRITLDGIPFLFVVDSLQHEEAFGRRSVRISGRSITALIGSPFARSTQWINTSGAATAQQLALQALDLSGVSLSWGLEDWLVPAGAWSHSGTPLSAVQAIVEAAGGYLQSARNAATLIAMHPYPTLTGGVLGGPWNWYASGVVPDVELAPDALVTTAIERIDGADINAVYVSGETQGVSRLVKRTGTAANKLSSPVVSALITADEAARQRGTAILGAAGPKHMVRATLPLLTGPSQPGILDVGQLIQVNAAQPWRGRVRSVSVAASFGAEVRQSVQIERHLEPA